MRPLLPLLLLIACASVARSQDPPSDMRPYWFGLIRRGELAQQLSPERVAELGRGHMETIGRLVESGELVLAGPFGHDGDLRGIFIYAVDTREQAEALVASDPAVAAGRLAVDLYPWWGPTALQDLLGLVESQAAEAEAEARLQKRQAVTGSPEQVADAYVSRYIAGDVDGLAELMGDDVRFEDPVSRWEGRAKVVAGLRAVFLLMTIEGFEPRSTIASGADRVLVSGDVTFTQSGNIVGRPEQTLRFTVPLAMSLRVVRGRVVEHIDLVDSAAYQAQLEAQYLGHDDG
jgi:uncharacterized protein YciI/predicted ester cyclase